MLDHPDIRWRRVSPRYVVVTLLGDVIWAVVFVAAAVVAFTVGELPWVAGGLAVLALGSLVGALLALRRARSIGYALRDDDLLFRRGLLVSRMVAVPYGRLQLVTVQSGPIARLLGFASLRVVTATAATGVVLPGIVAAEAADVRDRLIALAERRRVAA
ncbi:PH domain-containing protein [Pseudoclavibacter chungangensis]|uniref:PH domain-containing protein n=1 Tax=Pseudoclavibacter chungangensis TaxID=587635 RepID=A0A7J5BNK1_9MICO|nr:PH domain-containing protein [Pseudoclavibacter chungangensis]KAB1653639.1 PH domain-containing protein [Pseudoclavibacter chungangensis]NYJ68753.1 hypothetical protein [Pseudoclavibacter chungangensis]